jgi:hypothetical protein
VHSRLAEDPRPTEAGLAVRAVMLGTLTITLIVKVAVVDCDPSLTVNDIM